MKVLQLCKYYPPAMGGIELVEKTITKAHRELDDDVLIVAFAPVAKISKGEFGEDVYNIKEDLFLKSAPFNFSLIFKLRSLIKENNIQRIYVHLPNPFMHEAARMAKGVFKKLNVEIVAVYHSDIVNQKFLGKLYSVYFKLSSKFYDKWMCSSQKLWSSSNILNTININKKRVIPFCTDGVIEYKPRQEFKGKLLAVGRLVPYKGFDFLIEVINKTHYELHIIGNGPQLEKLERSAGKNITLHKNISDQKKRDLFNDCDVLVMSSINRSEAYGMIIVEAFEAGLPVVAANINSGVTFLVQNEKTGLVFDIKNEEQLLAALKRLQQNQLLYSQLSRNAREFFEQELTFERFKQKIKEL